jgi:RNA exonuclease 1
MRVLCVADWEVQVLSGMLSSIGSHDFTIGRFMELSHNLGCEYRSSLPRIRVTDSSLFVGSQPTNAATGKSSTTLPGILPSDSTTLASSLPLSEVHSSLNARLASLHASLPPLTAFIIFTGHSDPQEMARLAAKKAHFDKLWKTVAQSSISGEDRWMEEDDRNLLVEVEKCRSGLSFYCIK